MNEKKYIITKNKTVKKKKNNALRTLLIIIAFIGLFLTGYAIYNWIDSKNFEVPSVKDLIYQKGQIDYSDKDKYQYSPSTTYKNELPSIRSQYGNNNIVARLEIPGVDIDTYVARAQDNAYYLNHNIYNQYDELGYPFADYRNRNLNEARQINIYGHSSQVESLHDKLELINIRAYLDKNFFDNYQYMYLSLDEAKYRYRVEAVKIVNSSDPEHMKVVFYNDNDFINHTQKLYQNTIYKRADTTITARDKLIVLQICNYNPPKSYLLVIAKQM